MAERARVARDRLPGTALAAAQLFSLKPTHHARTPSHPSPPSSHERGRWWPPAHSHADIVPAYHTHVRYRAAAHDLIDDRTEHAVGRDDVAPGAGVDWVGCCVDDDLLSEVDLTAHAHAGRSADGRFGDGALVDRFIGAVGYDKFIGTVGNDK